ncbi:ATP-binding cassette domain-containing protein [Mumia sp. ZJ1417]|uniref:ATP-binding cassette domain-containing protein n=1 Tax=Mumia sp. ZJ1417 TaxID=2708082 RepID=UPI00141E2CD9|nr:ATP-binding cassette domain-containing protein [Mumia sp. ZJ1417]QMW65677.1 ATP-binding cassette domain-containing protein [Mumia sp. ZJ1417]
MNHAIHAEGLTKRFGDTQALDGVDLTVPEGTVLGVLGPNGAGKTTAVRVLATLLRADSGHATVAGYDVARQPGEVRRAIGLTGQYASVDQALTARENLVLVGRLLDLPRRSAVRRAAELLEQFGLTGAADRRAVTYSGGMRRRLDLAASLVGRPQVIFLDEPTTGLDPSKRDDMWNVVRGLTEAGTTVLLTTQYLEEADALADRISVIDHGRVIAEGTPHELKALVGGRTLQVRPSDPDRLAEVAALLHRVADRPVDEPQLGTIGVPVEDDAVLTTVVRALDERGIAVTELTLTLPDLDEVFFALTGRSTSPDTSVLPSDDKELVR